MRYQGRSEVAAVWRQAWVSAWPRCAQPERGGQGEGRVDLRVGEHRGPVVSFGFRCLPGAFEGTGEFGGVALQPLGLAVMLRPRHRGPGGPARTGWSRHG